MSGSGRALSFLEQVNAGTVTAPALLSTLGFTLGSCSEGEASFTLVTDPARHGNLMGTLHGGVIAAIADSAMGFAFACTLGAEETFATLEMKVSFLRPVWRSTLTASAKVVHRGRTTGLVDCRVTDERDRLIAHATSTCLVLGGAQAEGRGLGDTKGG
ncbi:MAG: PaaI family thioesterase [Gemmatimonadaceae bacterium]|nr:PaaI family thioesterase [Gemmatimonadaceae bacterium]